MTNIEMLDCIEGLCKSHNILLRYWTPDKGWFTSKEDFAPYIRCTGSDANLHGLSRISEDCKWGSSYAADYWVIRAELLDNPDFQSDFEREFYTRLLNNTFL
jgi:hypothetical protein